MKKIFHYIFLFIIGLPTAVGAQQVNPLDSLQATGEQIYGPNATTVDLKVTIGRIVQTLLGFIGTIFIVLIIVSGFQWMTSGGNEKKIADAKRHITNATIGLVIIVIAYSIAYTITRYLALATSPENTIP